MSGDSEDFGKIATALGLFASCIKSGEDWSGTCETVKTDAFDALARIAALVAERDALRKALEECAESLAHARDKLGMCGEGDGQDRKADAPDDIGSLRALTAARAALSQHQREEGK